MPVLANANEKVLYQRRKRSILDVAFDHCSSEECVRPKPSNLAVKGSSSLKVIISLSLQKPVHLIFFFKSENYTDNTDLHHMLMCLCFSIVKEN